MPEIISTTRRQFQQPTDPACSYPKTYYSTKFSTCTAVRVDSSGVYTCTTRLFRRCHLTRTKFLVQLRAVRIEWHSLYACTRRILCLCLIHPCRHPKKFHLSKILEVVSRPEFAQDHESGLRSDRGRVALCDFSKQWVNQNDFSLMSERTVHDTIRILDLHVSGYY